MKNIAFLFLLTLFCSCQKEFLDDNQIVTPHVTDTSTVSIHFGTTDMNEIDTRAGAETTITDLNIYIFCDKYNIKQNHYLTSASNLTLELVNGEYEVYVIGNWGGNLGAMTKSALLNLKSTMSSEAQITANNRMVMSCFQRISISRNSTVQILLNRLAVKVNFNISMSAAMSADSKIIHIQPYSCNGAVSLFADSRIINTGSPTIKYPTYDVSASNLKSLSKSYYFMENMQGRNNAVTSPNGRIQANAPTYSTYLWIRIERNMKYIDYRVYLGENDTNDFNISRNTNYNYNIVILGENPTDLRVSTTSIIFHSGNFDNPNGSYNKFVWNSRVAYAKLIIITTNNEPDNVYNVSFYKGSGTFASDWTMDYQIRVSPFDYLPIKERQNIVVHAGSGQTIINFAFWNGGSLDVHTVDNIFYFTVSDKYGYKKNVTLQTAHYR